MAEIKVPKVPKSAFNPQRYASGLLRDQVDHLEWAVRHAGERLKKGRKAYSLKKIKTEADVSARMATLLPKLVSADRLPFDRKPIPGDDTTPVSRRKRKTAAKRRTKGASKTRAARKTRTAKTARRATRKARAKR